MAEFILVLGENSAPARALEQYATFGVRVRRDDY